MSNRDSSGVLKRIPYGFYTVTSRHNDDSNVMVLNWLTQVSYQPQMIAIGLQKSSYSHLLIENEKVFAVNLFLKEDQDLIKSFTKGRSKNPDKMKGVQYEPAPQTGCPILAGAAAYLECKVVDIHDDGGDHDIVVGEVIGGGEFKEGHVTDTLTLAHLGWNYAG